ncbi:MAG: AAA family ATPase [Gammaproteobacteria bacterium]|nr:AAA family ATPase [Gammaproteobacteria bacterium]MBU1731871.1 AAA family ATPase [Gammaproteobacteria bacterium]MBU1892482.1 AAA family ATPase [Gammaproteobacteria bacterium]
MSEYGTLPLHLKSLGLERNPFPQTPDADCYFRTENIERQFTEALHCMLAGKGFMLLTGEVGTGKSTFLRALMDELIAADCAVSFVFNTFLQGRDLLLAVNRDFGLDAGADLADDIDRLNHFLIEQNRHGKTCVVVIDDAQNLDTSSLELLRLLSNLETRQTKLLQIVLSGQPELLDVLAKPEIRQLASRIVQHTRLSAFTPAECSRYVDFRISRASSDGRIRLDKAAQGALHRHSLGNPRRVHLIMDRCMYGVVSCEQREIGKRLVDMAAGEVGVAGPAQPQHRARNWMLTVLACLGIGVAAWAGAPSSTMRSPVLLPARVPAQVQAEQPLRSCLENLGAGKWNSVLQNSMSIEIQTAIGRSLAENGLALARQPAGWRIPSQTGGSYCQWESHASTWLVWRPSYLPFDLANEAQGENIRWLQARLAEAGHYSFRVDGMVGIRTIEALQAFRIQNGLPADGGADAWTLFMLEHNIGKRVG